MKYTQNKYSIMYSKIDRKQLSEQALATLEKLRKATGNFRTKNQEPLDLFEDFYKKLEDKKPTAIKGSVAYKEMIKEKQKQIGKELYRQRVEKQKAKAEGKGGERDAHRPAKPFGWRLKGKHNYRKPTRADITEGRAYYEGRVNRADVKRKKYPMLERGGYMAKGGVFENFIKSQIEYIISLKSVSEKKKNISNILSNMDDYVGNEMQKNITADNLKYALTKSTISEINKVLENSLNVFGNGGYMAKGGMISHGFRSGDKIIEIYKGYGIIENTNGGIEVINPSNGTRFVIDIEEGGDPKKYIDWANQINPIELVARIDTGIDRTTGSMDANGVQYAKGGVFYTEKHKND